MYENKIKIAVQKHVIGTAYYYYCYYHYHRWDDTQVETKYHIVPYTILYILCMIIIIINLYDRRLNV